MFTRSIKLFIGILKFILPIFVVLIFQLSANSQTYTQNEQDCYNMVQGKVVYSKAVQKKWAEGDVRYLCRGTTFPARTVDCFNLRMLNYGDPIRGVRECTASALNNQVIDPAKDYKQNEQDCHNLVQGKVAYDKAGNKTWSEGNVRRLCKNTTSPVRTVDCFNLRIANYNDWKRGLDECSGELNGKWIVYGDDGKLTSGRFEIVGLGSVDILTAAGQPALRGQRSGNNINSSFKDYFGNVLPLTGVISNTGTRIEWSNKTIWIKDDGKPPAANVPVN